MRAYSKMLNAINLKVTLTDDFKVALEETCPMGEITRYVADVRARAMEQGVRKQLINLGWMSPEEAKGMVAIDRVLSMLGAGATKQELLDWLLELKR